MSNSTDFATQSLKQEKENLLKKITELDDLLSRYDDKDLRDMANGEKNQLLQSVSELEKTIENIESGGYEKSDSNESVAKSGDCIIEIRAGTGGDEAGLFAGNLFVMYSKYSENKKWKVDIISKNEGGIGNLKEIVFEVKGGGSNTPYEMFEHESGTHRVQRVPVTESGGRIHTSTATVAVLPIVTEKELVIKPEDLRIDVYRASGAGGQHVNKTESAIRITHIPTGTVSQCQDERSQHKNKERAMLMLRSRIYEMMHRQQKNSIDEIRAEQVGSGERSEKIRTYNFPQDRITDHRIKKSWFGMNKVLMGEINDMLSDIQEAFKNGDNLETDLSIED